MNDLRRRSGLPGWSYVVIGLVLLGGLLAVGFALVQRHKTPLSSTPAPMKKGLDVRAEGTNPTAIGVNSGTINIHNAPGSGEKDCERGLQPYGERCVSQAMADYVSCVEASGGNKQEITEAVSSSGQKRTSAEAEATVKGVVVSGSGKLALGLADEEALVKKFESKWFSGGMSECTKALSGPLRAAATKAHKK